MTGGVPAPGAPVVGTPLNGNIMHMIKLQSALSLLAIASQSAFSLHQDGHKMLLNLAYFIVDYMAS